ncbi:hypothetical protein [Ornithinibacillus contaminans]|uniref:hypothetical protein n=1 Tax=Ornithinibacillus contaminans TaxID=694055 RepID=UPI00064D876B|nr:hypothetical protein [Ornithinibacillus contaminans]
MKTRFVFLLLFLVLLTSACTNGDELSGRTFNVSYLELGPDALDADFNSPEGYSPFMKLEFLDENIVKNKLGYEEGTYEWNKDTLVLLFENENEKLEIELTLKESDKEFSAYSATISDADFEMTDTDKISYFQNLFYQLNNDRQMEFLK